MHRKRNLLLKRLPSERSSKWTSITVHLTRDKDKQLNCVRHAGVCVCECCKHVLTANSIYTVSHSSASPLSCPINSHLMQRKQFNWVRNSISNITTAGKRNDAARALSVKRATYSNNKLTQKFVIFKCFCFGLLLTVVLECARSFVFIAQCQTIISQKWKLIKCFTNCSPVGAKAQCMLGRWMMNGYLSPNVMHSTKITTDDGNIVSFLVISTLKYDHEEEKYESLAI